MGDRPIRDRTLILRVLVPGLETRLRDKMEERAAAKKEADGGKSGGPSHPNSSSGGRDNNSNKEQLLDLEGVSCEPTSLQGNTLWNFHCDGAKYPARLVNLPCPVELHKTHDHAMYYKCSDVAQMLIVYEDSTALAEAEEDAQKMEGFPSYYHSGLTPALRRVVERRFAAREHSPVAPPRQEVSDVEEQLVDLMERISKEGEKGANKRTKVPSLTSAQLANKTLEEVSEEVVEYEPWMDDFGRQPHGVEFDADDPLCSHHPEVWLDPDEVREIRMKEAEEAELKKKKAASKKEKKNKKERQKKEKEQLKLEETAAAAATPHKKKGIASKKKAEEVDPVDQIAASMLTVDDDLEQLGLEDDDVLKFEFDGDDIMGDLQL
ncbi:TAFII55 protein conserved region [Seminavis robusta]|uniref:TAFII55 protein conserved region n=1 Tax=Seminavis robusta TaxID=568900 RepID=A0A9N8H1H3_9STRA|nr:TAFII55 protein conserved region [Seminavis robusta]|eukprot:Sro17_g012270.1 TAFII55 protein conserved region (378) ;mRNA; f:69209-70430